MNHLFKIQYKILIVDDITDNIQLISDLLYEEGMSVTVARSGKQALKSISIKQPDLILLDIAMPEMDGYQVCEIIKKDPATSHIPIIFLTAKSENEDLIKGFSLGAVDYITKPFNIPELIARVNTHLELKRSRDIIQEQNLSLIQLNSAKDKFFSVLENDFKIPFQLMMNLINHLTLNFEKLQTSEIKTKLFELKNATHLSNELINKLIEWSHILTSNIDINVKKFDIDLVIKSNVELFKEQAKEKSINFIYEKPVTNIVNADPKLTDTILKNLISNAIKFTNSGGDVIISVKDEENAAEITIYDTGIGIKEDIKTNLFKPEIFISTNGTANEKGLGLGLIISKKYIELQGGKIWIESMPGIGSDVKFTLPK